MDLVLGIAVGALIGWLAFLISRAKSQQRVRTFVVIGLIGGGLGVQLASMFAGTPSQDGAFDLRSLVIAAVVASAGLVINNMILGRRVD